MNCYTASGHSFFLGRNRVNLTLHVREIQPVLRKPFVFSCTPRKVVSCLGTRDPAHQSETAGFSFYVFGPSSSAEFADSTVMFTVFLSVLVALLLSASNEGIK